MMSWGGEWGWGAALAMAAMMAAFWALLIWAVLTVTRRADSDRDSESILAEQTPTVTASRSSPSASRAVTSMTPSTADGAICSDRLDEGGRT
jgi:hypothetical protein